MGDRRLKTKFSIFLSAFGQPVPRNGLSLVQTPRHDARLRTGREIIHYPNQMKATFPVLKSNRATLRQFVDSDLENVFKGLSHPEIIRYYGVSYDSIEATKQQMKWFADLEKNETGIWWAICAKEDGRFLGAGGLCELSKENQKAEIGFWLLPENWGQGFMSETMPLILNHAFDEIGLHRIEGFVESENTNCKKALAKLNFNLEGTMQDCEIKNGKFISVDIYSKIARQ